MKISRIKTANGDVDDALVSELSLALQLAYLPKGAAVQISGLTDRPSLNGCGATIISCLRDGSYRCAVEIQDCGTFDMAIARLFGAGRYFALHTAINMVCVAFTWRDAILALSFANPFDSNSCVLPGTPCANKLSMDLTMGIHLWHSLAYALKPIDWIHHLPAHAVCAIGIFLAWGPVLNLSIIVLMGIPGGIDYALLTATKLGLLHPSVEKNLNQSLNVWLRCPVTTLSAYLMFFGALLHPEHFAGTGHRVGHALIGVHHFWNGNFFMYRTVDARTRYVLKEKEKKAQAAGGK